MPRSLVNSPPSHTVLPSFETTISRTPPLTQVFHGEMSPVAVSMAASFSFVLPSMPLKRPPT